MLISMNWIEDFVDLTGINKIELIQRFTLSTAEVEEIEIKGDNLKQVVSAKISTVENHPNSKKLHLLKVDAGDKIYDVVCGAPNVRPGLLIPFVKEGGQVLDMEIKRTTIAGFESQGMCCSALELGISSDNSGLMELPEGTPIGVDIAELFPIKDIVFEVDNKSLTNRPDLWGHYGIAREFAALAERELMPLEILSLNDYKQLPTLDIEIASPELCYRYSAITVNNIQANFSPIEMQIRLFYCGTRSINLLADLTNYIMLELGQPMHAFDNSKVKSISVKRFEKPFEFQTLDKVPRHIDKDTLMICSDNNPVAVAGIMGGLDSEIEADTVSLLLESANFDAVSVRKTSTRLGLRTDASMRYEKCLDPEMTVVAISRFVKILLEIEPLSTVSSSLTDMYVKLFPTISLQFDKNYIDRYTGIEISNEQILKTLTSLGFEVKLTDCTFHVTVPSWRATKDVTIKADIVEEITRIYGYDNFQLKTSTSPLFPVKKSPANRTNHDVQDLLIETFALHEVQTYLWCDRKKYKELNLPIEPNVRVINGMTADNDMIRNSMTPNLLCIVSENKSYSDHFGIFEIGRTVNDLNKDGLCEEIKTLGITLYSRTTPEKELFYQLLEMTSSIAENILHGEFTYQNSEVTHAWQHPKNTAVISLANQELGFITIIHPSVTQLIDKKASIVSAEINLDLLAELPLPELSYAEPSKFPGIDIDLSLQVDAGVNFSDLTFAWEALGRDILKRVDVIDIFDIDDKRSVTIRFAFVSPVKTLSKTELQPLVNEILLKLAQKGIGLKK